MGVIPRRRRSLRNAARSSAVSATTSVGRGLGRSRLRGTRMVRTVASARVRSCGCALATCRPMGTPVPSTTTITLEPLPTVVVPPPVPLVALERRCRQETHVPMPACRRYRGGAGGCANCAPTFRRATTRAIVASRCWGTRPPLAGLPRHSPWGAGSTDTILFSVRRSSVRGRPRVRCCFGMRGSLTAHWSSVRSWLLIPLCSHQQTFLK